MRNVMMRLVCCAAVLGMLVLAPAQAPAELLIGLTNQNSLISFDSATPGATTTPLPVTGLVAGDALVGIDIRPTLGPNNGLLYGVGVNSTDGSGRVYTIDTLTGAATLRSTLVADPADTVTPTPFTAVMGTFFGVDFNPVVDRLRVVSESGQNLRINVDNGRTQLDVPLAYDAADTNAGQAPMVTAVAYANNFGGTTSTTLRGVDIGTTTDTLVLHSNPNGGILQTQLMTGFNSTGLVGYDVSGITGTPYFSFTAPTSTSSQLFRAGAGGFTLVDTIGGGIPLAGLAAPVGPTVPEPSSLLLLGLGTAGLLSFGWQRRKRVA